MINIAIDGPSGAGKSFLAKEIAKKLDFIYVDTGALYRCIGLYMYKNKINTKNRIDIIHNLSNIKLSIRYINSEQRVFLSDIDVSDEIRLPEISMYASEVSSISEVREFLFDTQRDMAEKSNVIMDGRDIGTVILPNAQVKIFLTASIEARAKRRFDELCEKNIKTTYSEVLDDIIKRDNNDKNRDVSPAIPAIDSIMVDNSLLDKNQTLDIVLKIIEAKLK